ADTARDRRQLPVDRARADRAGDGEKERHRQKGGAPGEQERVRTLDGVVDVARSALGQEEVLLESLGLVGEHVLAILEERLVAGEAVRGHDVALVRKIAAAAE